MEITEAPRRTPRYFVVPPVPDGYPWWTVRDADSTLLGVAELHKDLDGAGQMAYEICDRLNRRHW
jgi:hypothetical protein